MSQFRDTADYTAAAGEDLIRHRLVRFNSSGAYVYCDKGERPIGAAQETTDSGDYVNVDLVQNKPGTVKLVADGAISQYDDVFTADDGKISATPSACKVGKALEAASADGDVIEVLPDVEDLGKIEAATAASSAVTNTTDETTLNSVTLESGVLQKGDVIRVRAQGIATSTNGTDTLNIKLYVGTEEIVETGAVDVADDDIWLIDADIVVRADGASGSLVAAGVVALGVEGTVTAKPFKKAVASEDLSGAVTIKTTATWSAASASNSCREDVFNVQVLR